MVLIGERLKVFEIEIDVFDEKVNSGALISNLLTKAQITPVSVTRPINYDPGSPVSHEYFEPSFIIMTEPVYWLLIRENRNHGVYCLIGKDDRFMGIPVAILKRKFHSKMKNYVRIV